MTSFYKKKAREQIAQDKFYLSHHAQIERGEEQISIDDIIEVILNGTVIETYPDDPRGESCLFSGQGKDKRWIHVLCGNFYEQHLLIITVYMPTKPKWIDPFTRRKK